MTTSEGLPADGPWYVYLDGLARAEAALTEATGLRYSVTEYAGYHPAEDGEGWTLPVYAAPEDSDDGHAVADAGLPGWIEWLTEQALEALPRTATVTATVEVAVPVGEGRYGDAEDRAVQAAYALEGCPFPPDWGTVGVKVEVQD